jgi:hypothetical protein
MSDVHPFATAWERDHAKQLRWLAFFLVLVGLAWRCGRYFLTFPIWGDEAMLLNNYFTRGYADLFGPIDNCQIAPLLYHVAELTVINWLGHSELAVRLPGFLACLGSLLLFWRLARLTLPPLAHALSVGILAVSIWPVSMGSLVKPYAFDLFFSLALLVPAVAWIREPSRGSFPLALVIVAPIAMIGSYPCVFVGGAIALTLLPMVWRRRDGNTWIRYTLYVALLGGSFFVHYLLVGRPHLSSPVSGVTTAVGMHTYWANAFPPSDPLDFVLWFTLIHIGQIAAYPLGAAKGGSALTVLFACIGMVWMWRRQQRPLVCLIFATFALWFVASLLHKYPYGLSCRLSQHVAPYYCLLAGMGVGVCLMRISCECRRMQTLLTISGVLALVGVGGLTRDIIQPFRDDNTVACRAIVRELLHDAGDDPVLIFQHASGVDPVFVWYLGQHGERVRWADHLDWATIGRTQSSVWVFCYGDDYNEGPQIKASLSHRTIAWRCVEKRPIVMRALSRKIPDCHCRVYHLVRPTTAQAR